MRIPLTFLAFTSGETLAHATETAGQSPWPLLLLALLLVTYASGLRRLWCRAGVGRGIPWWRALTFLAGWAVLVYALTGEPGRHAGERFSAHMTQHMLLMLIAAPLLVMSAAPFVIGWTLPGRWRRVVLRWRPRTARQHAGVVWVAFAVTLWWWHVPHAYEWALINHATHAAEHLTMLAVSVAFWAVVARPFGLRPAAVTSVLYLFTTMLHCGLLGALITFAPAPLYLVYQHGHAGPLTPLEDQQLAGLIMWVPSSLVLVLACLAILARWLLWVESAEGIN